VAVTNTAIIEGVMKIIGPDSLQHPQPGSTPSPKGPGQASNFSEMLRETLSQPGSSDAVQKPSSLQEPQAVHNVRQVLKSDSLVDSASQVLDLLDSYSKALADPGKTLRDIEPELTAFVTKTQSLYEAYLENGQDDPKLKSVMEELLRTAQMEDVRFHRGDYLDAE
jgi:cobalamin biosynthesis protein CobT